MSSQDDIHSLLSPEDTLVAFYNLENAFDIYDNPSKHDDDFLPEGLKHWNTNRYKTKIEHLSEAIKLLHHYGTPALIGLTEVENKEVLNDLVSHSQLNKVYGFVHHQSADARGIDVALLYNMYYFKVLEHKGVSIQFAERPHFLGRDILYVKGCFADEDDLHIFINHWPSRREGINNTHAYRMAAARTVMAECEALWATDEHAKILLMGDFNDEASDESIEVGLSAKVRKHMRYSDFYNLSALPYKMRKGSAVFGRQWYLFDQILVSRGLREAEEGVCVLEEGQQILNDKKIMIYDKDIHDYVPWRTFEANDKYVGGYSDHLPVFAKLSMVSKLQLKLVENDKY